MSEAELKAMAINDFLYLLSQGNSPRVAFERALDDQNAGEGVLLVVPSNVDIVVRP